MAGTKVVTAKRGAHPKWTSLFNEAELIEHLHTAGLLGNEVFGTRKMITPAVAKTLLGKEKYKLDDLIVVQRKVEK